VLIRYFQLFMGSSFVFQMAPVNNDFSYEKHSNIFRSLCDDATPLNDVYQCITLNSGSFVFLGSFDGLERTVLSYKRQRCVQKTSQQYCNRWFQLLYVQYYLHPVARIWRWRNLSFICQHTTSRLCIWSV